MFSTYSFFHMSRIKLMYFSMNHVKSKIDATRYRRPVRRKAQLRPLRITSTTRGARTKKGTTQSLFTSESCLSASKILSCASLRPDPLAVLFFVRGVDMRSCIKYCFSIINSNIHFVYFNFMLYFNIHSPLSCLRKNTLKCTV